MRKQYWIAGVIVVLVVVIVVAMKGSQKPVATTSEPIVLGTLICQTGPCAEWGENSMNGIRMAVDEINTSGGVLGRQIKLASQDSSESTPLNAINGYKNLVAMGVHLIIGPTWGPAGAALAPVAAKDRGTVVIMSPSLGIADFNEASDNVFNIWPHDDIGTRALARYAFAHGVKTVAIYGSKEAWYDAQSSAFGDEFTKAGGKVLLREDQDSTARDVNTIAAKLKATNADAVFYAHYNNMGVMAKELKALGYKGAQYAVNVDESRLQTAQGALEGTIYALYAAAKTDFQPKYAQKYGKQPGVSADSAYDAVYLYARAIADAGTDDAARVNSVMSSYKTFKGASGDLTFDGKRGVTKPPAFWHIKDGKLVQI